MSFDVGETVGPYRIIEQLGQGGMATVYKAYHAALDRYVALKVLHPAFHEDQTFLARFQREARVVAKLEHPFIVPVYDYAEHEGRPYLVMKFIEGETLKARLGHGPLPSQEIEKVVDSVGSALAYAHRQGILHRDIKPSNVLIATNGEMYLADFGLARIAQDGESTLSSDSIMGTPQYISPEQALGKKDLDEGTDIYSFGVMLYEMVVGRVPFSADTPFSIIHDHIYTPLPLPMEVNPRVPEPVQRVLLKALAKDRADRFATVNDMMKAFKDAWKEAGIPMEGTSTIVPPSTMKRAAQAVQKAERAVSDAKTVAAAAKSVQPAVPVQKRPTWLYAAGGVLIILCCVFAFFAFRQGGFFARGKGPFDRQATQTVPAQVSIPATLTQVPATTDSQVALPTAIFTPSNLTPEIAAAQELVSNHPNDPDAHLQLSLAYWDAKQPRAALEELTQAANLAGPTNREFFLKAGDSFKKHDAWIAAAAMYLRAVQTYSVGEAPDQLMTDFSEAAYKSAEAPDMPLFLFFERIDRINQPLGYVVRGRYALFNGTLEDARVNLDQVKRIKPDMYEAALLEAEINFKEGHTDATKQILTSLSSDLGAPEWIRVMANERLKNIP